MEISGVPAHRTCAPIRSGSVSVSHSDARNLSASDRKERYCTRGQSNPTSFWSQAETWRSHVLIRGGRFQWKLTPSSGSEGHGSDFCGNRNHPMCQMTFVSFCRLTSAGAGKTVPVKSHKVFRPLVQNRVARLNRNVSLCEPTSATMRSRMKTFVIASFQNCFASWCSRAVCSSFLSGSQALEWIHVKNPTPQRGRHPRFSIRKRSSEAPSGGSNLQMSLLPCRNTPNALQALVKSRTEEICPKLRNFLVPVAWM